MQKKYFFLLIVISCLLNGCGDALPKESSNKDHVIISSTQQNAEIETADSYEAYTGVWSENGISHNKLISDGGTEFTVTIKNKNQVSGSLYSQQGISERIAEIDTITGNIKNGECEYSFFDDGFGGSGTLKIKFIGEEIIIEVMDYQMAENNPSGFGITGTYKLKRAELGGEKKKQETETSEQELFEAVYNRYYSKRSPEELAAATEAKRPYREKCSFYNEVSEYMENVRNVRDISNVAEPLYVTDMKYYSKEDFDGVPPLIIHLAKNEIYARHGYIFKNEDLNNYFMGQLWYEPSVNPDDFDPSVFNDYEKVNLELLAGLDKY